MLPFSCMHLLLILSEHDIFVFNFVCEFNEKNIKERTSKKVILNYCSKECSYYYYFFFAIMCLKTPDYL